MVLIWIPKQTVRCFLIKKKKRKYQAFCFSARPNDNGFSLPTFIYKGNMRIESKGSSAPVEPFGPFFFLVYTTKLMFWPTGRICVRFDRAGKTSTRPIPPGIKCEIETRPT